ncbi:prepilin-type N-terminal cleavage/methylation domain-containing protein [Candidatus Daviesbacteria bacterium]|nr:prepilin-type N-terminal cleavage/methylation domain-containing protein [Candidatus Daviesbacteria bacterium]
MNQELSFKKHKKNHHSFAFTLVEILVVVAVLSVVGILVLTIFTRTLRGTNKTQILGAIKQNGQSVLETMTGAIRNSDNIVCPLSASSNTLVVVTRGIYSRYRFIAQDTSNNGLIQQDNPAKQIDPATGQEETDPAFVNRICGPADPMVLPIVLTDTHPQSGVSLASGSFSLNRQAGFKDNVKITFELTPGVRALPVLVSEIGAITFETTIQLR